MMNDIEKIVNDIYIKLKSKLPPVWDGKDSIQYMKDNNCSQWRQME